MKFNNCYHTTARLNIDWNIKDKNGRTLFHLACGNGNSKIVWMLIQKSVAFNIDLNAKDKYGWTAFHVARGGGNSKIAEILREKSVEFKIDLTAQVWDEEDYFCRLNLFLISSGFFYVAKFDFFLFFCSSLIRTKD